MKALGILIKENIMLAVVVALMALASMVGVAMYQTYAEPVGRQFVTETVTDSLSIWTKRAKEKHPSGFRTGMSKLTGLAASDVTDSLASIYNNEANVYATITYLMDEQSYQKGFNSTIFLMITENHEYGGVRFRKTETKESGQFDIYYQDQFDKYWKAIYYADEDAYYFIPSYTNGQRVKCD